MAGIRATESNLCNSGLPGVMVSRWYLLVCFDMIVIRKRC